MILAALFVAITATSTGADWPGWRGPTRDGNAAPDGVLLHKLPAEPRTVWRLKIGDGLAAPVVSGNRVFYMDARDNQEVIHAIDRKTGEQLWKTPVDGVFKNGQTAPGPRCTPLVDGDRVYVQSCNGELQCLSVADGKVRWRVNFTKEFHAGVPAERGVAKGAQRHGFTAAPWVDGDRLIALVGDTKGAGIVCFDKHSGKILWQSQNDRAANAAPITARFANRNPRQIVAFTVEGLIGLDLEKGGLLWRIPITTTYGRHVTTPVVVDDVVMVASKEESLMGIEIAPQDTGSGWNATTRWQTTNYMVNFSSPVAVGRYIYGLGPEQNLFCLDTKTGKGMWSKDGFTTKPAEKAHLAMVAVGNNLLLLTEMGQLVLVAADPKGYRELGRTQACGENWCNPAYAEGKVYLRDARELLCLDLIH